MKKLVDLLRGKEESRGVCGRDISECADCELEGKLRCRFGPEDLINWALPILMIYVPGFAGMVRAGYGGWIGVYAVAGAAFLFLWENRALCSHCPHYAREGRRLRCYTHYGLYKPWRYRPGRMSRAEQIQWLVFLGSLAAYPVPFLILGKQHRLLAMTLLGIATLAGFMYTRSCKKCLNFSCPVNRVPKELKDEFLMRNDVMRKAWEAEGYKVGE